MKDIDIGEELLNVLELTVKDSKYYNDSLLLRTKEERDAYLVRLLEECE